MKVVLPGKPESQLQALTTGCWGSRRITAYITGNAFTILSEPDVPIQTVYDDEEDHLEAIALDEGSGKIAVCTGQSVRIYKPRGLEEDALKWVLQSSFEVQCPAVGEPQDLRISLSWGRSEELLVARSDLQLFQTSSTPTCIWQQRLANPVRLALISYDSAYIASVGCYDTLVKVWRRLSYESDTACFDFSYLSHPDLVTNLHWRRPHSIEQTLDNVLYTFCADNMLRIWVGSDSHGQQHPQLWSQFDLATSIQTRSTAASEAPSIRWAFIMHGRDLSAATEKAVLDGDGQHEEDAAALEHIIAIANRSPELCIVFDGRGHMSAWAFENVGVKPFKSNIFNVVHVFSQEFDFLGHTDREATTYMQGLSYCSSGSHANVLLHFFDGSVEVYQANVARLFDPRPKSHRLTLQTIWSGHSAAVRKIVRSFSGQGIVSRTAGGESIVWNHDAGAGGRAALTRKTELRHEGHIHRMCVLRKGRFLVLLFHDAIALWDCRQPKSVLLAQRRYDMTGKPLCLLVLPRQRAEDHGTAHVATISSDKQGIVWEVQLPEYSSSCLKPITNGHTSPSIREFVRFKFEDAADLAYMSPVDPAGSTPIISGFLDVFARDVAISYTRLGRVEFWTARVDVSRTKVEWLSTSSLETGISDPVLVSGSTMKKAAVVNSTRSSLTIWDIRGARLEYAQDFEAHNTIQDLDWTSTPDSQSILAVGFPHRVLLLSQMRFDYLNKGPAWAAIREINIRDMTPHPIGDSTWLGDGYLVIGAGNQLFVYDRQFDGTRSSSLVPSLQWPHRKGGHRDLFDVVQRLNGPLPVFHPQFLSQCMLAGKTSLVHRILMALHHTLLYWIEGDAIDDYLGMNMDEFYGGDLTNISSSDASPYLTRRSSSDSLQETFSEEVAESIGERLTRVGVPQLTGHEQIQLMDIVECAGVVDKQRRSLDENGARFMLFFRQHALRKGRTNEIYMSWREINWAYHSGSQDILVDFVSKQHHGNLSWETARESGMFMWLTDANAVRAQFEVIARNEYTKSEMKNPVDCSLFYLALRKKTVLQGLWRMASWNREQGATQRLLANNFDDPKWRTAALKNAYALISKRRFEYAVAFFLLADHLQDAVNVCLNQIKDLQLAIAVARVYEGDQGPILRKLLEEEVLAIAAQEGNRWLASWAFWMLHRRDMAVRALITPVFTFLETPCTPDLKSKLFLTDDPALVVLYAQLRQKTLQTLRGASKVTPKVEWEFVLHNARLYDRMGCDLLGLDLVRNWEFLQASSSLTPGLGGEINPLGLLKRRSSLVVADLPISPVTAQTSAEIKSGGPRQQAPPTVFEEPDVNFLLDSFGF